MCAENQPFRTGDSVKAVDALEQLLTTEVVGEWREIPLGAAEAHP